MLYVITVFPRVISLATKLTWVLTIAEPAFAIAGLFLTNWIKRGELRAKS